MLQLSRLQPSPPTASSFISREEAYEYCRTVTAMYSKTFYLGTLLMPKEKREAIWAIYVWCRRTDELVDGPEAVNTTQKPSINGSGISNLYLRGNRLPIQMWPWWIA